MSDREEATAGPTSGGGLIEDGLGRAEESTRSK